MIKSLVTALVLALLVAAPLLPHPEAVAQQASYTPVTKYDPARDAAKDIADAVAEAKRTGRNVLVEIGGDWCGWCKTMEAFYAKNPSLAELRAKNYVTVKVFFSAENRNEKALKPFPETKSTPHLLILDGTGRLLHSQESDPLESGQGYDLEKFTAFLKKWAPAK